MGLKQPTANPTNTLVNEPAHAQPWAGLEEQLAAQLPNFEQFFKTFGFKRIHGRIWGLLVLAGQPLSRAEISDYLKLSQGASSTALTELTEWGTITSEFDSVRRCHLHAPVSNTLSIVATVLRRREQVVFQHFKLSATRTLAYVSERHGDKDPRVFTLRSIISTCEIAESVMQLVVGAVASALDDSESILSKAIHTALRVGVVGPSKLLMGRPRARRGDAGAALKVADRPAARELGPQKVGRD
jgi:DNA-binding transcriptional regulator GbsR (MarR family)